MAKAVKVKKEKKIKIPMPAQLKKIRWGIAGMIIVLVILGLVLTILKYYAIIA